MACAVCARDRSPLVAEPHFSSPAEFCLACKTQDPHRRSCSALQHLSASCAGKTKTNVSRVRGSCWMLCDPRLETTRGSGTRIATWEPEKSEALPKAKSRLPNRIATPRGYRLLDAWQIPMASCERHLSCYCVRYGKKQLRTKGSRERMSLSCQ